jgi:hypothetical protein
MHCTISAEAYCVTEVFQGAVTVRHSFTVVVYELMKYQSKNDDKGVRLLEEGYSC